MNPDDGDDPGAGVERPAARRRRQRLLIEEAGVQLLEDWGEVQYKNWMFTYIAQELQHQGEEVTYFQVRYALKGR